MRDWVIARIDRIQKIHRQEKERKLLQAVEVRSLRMAGVADAEARKRARRAAAIMVERAEEVREGRRIASMAAQDSEEAVGGMTARSIFATIDVEVERPESPRERYRHEGYLKRKYGGPLGVLFGPQARLVYGLALLMPFLLWLYQNGKLSEARRAMAAAEQVVERTHDELAAEPGRQAINAPNLPTLQVTQPLEISGLRPDIAQLFGTYNAGVAALLLMISALFGGVRVGYVLVPAAAFMVAGHLIPHVPQFGVEQQEAATALTQQFLRGSTLLIGMGLATLGILFVRDPSGR